MHEIAGKICFSSIQCHLDIHRQNKTTLQPILECLHSPLVSWLELVHINVCQDIKMEGLEDGMMDAGMSRGRQTHNLKCHAVGITLSPALLALWGNKHTFTNERTVHPSMGGDIKMNLKSSMNSKIRQRKDRKWTKQIARKKKKKRQIFRDAKHKMETVICFKNKKPDNVRRKITCCSWLDGIPEAKRAEKQTDRDLTHGQ